MLYPSATFRPVSNQGGPMSPIRGLVLHVQEGNGSLFGWFNNPASQVSAHFWISKGGSVEQYVDTNRIAWAEAAGNPNYLSVETEGFVAEPLTTAQIEQTAELLVWSSEQYGFPIAGPVAHGSPGFTPHCNPDGTVDLAWGGHSCPGPVRLGQMSGIIAAAQPPAPPSKKGQNMLTFDPKSGGYWVARPNGNVYTFNGAPYLGPLPHFLASWGIGTPAKPITGIAADGQGGFTLSADDGGAEPNIYHITADGAFAK